MFGEAVENGQQGVACRPTPHTFTPRPSSRAGREVGSGSGNCWLLITPLPLPLISFGSSQPLGDDGVQAQPLDGGAGGRDGALGGVKRNLENETGSGDFGSVG